MLTHSERGQWWKQAARKVDAAREIISSEGIRPREKHIDRSRCVAYVLSVQFMDLWRWQCTLDLAQA
jgi:hypothetical protein